MNWWLEGKRAAEQLAEHLGPLPATAVVLGSGWKSFVDKVTIERSVETSAIPFFPHVKVQGHGGLISVGTLSGERLVIVQGRAHLYEGHTMEAVTRVVRTLALGGVERFVLTNAAGCSHPDWPIPSLMVIEDHINWLGSSPLVGENNSDLGPRFPDMTRIYDSELRRAFLDTAAECDIRVYQGVYLAALGPAYETPAEVRMCARWGADALGMSTVPEAIALAHLGKRILAVSCLTNHAAGLSSAALDHLDVLVGAQRVVASFEAIFAKFLARVSSARLSSK